ncbi:hypothetical protein LB503_004166 [Fusarium chuoi]|nr:hypothetical protein LB503_004166 [Fusarium chuoi]
MNNAGVTYQNKDFDTCFRVHFKGVFFGSQTFLPELIKQGGGGTMINVVSVGATRPQSGLVWYNASKGGIWNVSCNMSTRPANSDVFHVVT